MHFAEINDRELLRQAILLKIGHFYQDDYLSCYGNREVLGKAGTEEGKCTWLVVTALERATAEQRGIYDDVDLPGIYFTYERETYNLLSIHIQRMARDLPREFFRKLLNDLHHRAK